MLSTKSFFVRFLREHELHGFNECFPILLIAGTRVKGQGLIALSTSELQNLKTKGQGTPLIKKC